MGEHASRSGSVCAKVNASFEEETSENASYGKLIRPSLAQTKLTSPVDVMQLGPVSAWLAVAENLDDMRESTARPC
jgi:hypothetical protein